MTLHDQAGTIRTWRGSLETKILAVGPHKRDIALLKTRATVIHSLNFLNNYTAPKRLDGLVALFIARIDQSATVSGHHVTLVDAALVIQGHIIIDNGNVLFAGLTHQEQGLFEVIGYGQDRWM